MAVINLRNVVALGVLEDGVYPSVYNGQTGEYIGTVDGEGAGVKTVPTLYMYYRKNGHLYLYRTKERIEIDLTNVTAYDNSALFKLTEKSDISSAKITEFESRNIDVGHYEYKVPWVKSTQQYLYILVPIVRSIHTITVQGIISNQIFTLTGIYVHEGKSWWIYRTNVKTNFDFNDAVNEILDVQVYVRELTAEDLNPVEQLTKLLFEHINNKFNPHEVTKEQVGLGNVDNTADMDKPVSRPQKEYIDALENRVKGWFKQLNVWINNHVTEVNKKFQDVWAAINKKLDKEDYENDKDNFNAHIRNYDNPHRVTAAQVGLPTAASDIEKLKQKAQELQGLLINKQDKTSEELVTDNKRIVDAINEIYGIVVEHNNHVRSNSINQIEVTSEIPTTFEDGTLWIRIPRNEEDYITIKIEAVPVDSTIRMINSEGKESAGVGSASLECLIQSRLHYIVEKENYITKDVYVDVGVEDTTINVVLTPKTKKTLTVNATPDNALIIFTDKPSNVVIAQGTGTLTYETYDPRDILIQVGASGYETYEERITLDENIIRDITLTALPVEQGAVSLTVVDSETKAKIAAYVYDKDTGGILGQVTKDTPLQLTGDVNTGRILRFVSSGYIEVEQLVTYAIPTAEVTVEMDKVPVQTGTIYATAVNTESTALDSVTFEYKLSTESDWKPLGNDESTTGKSEVVTAPVGTSVDFRASKTGYITNTGTGTINSTGEHSVTIVLEELPPEPEEVSVTIKIEAVPVDSTIRMINSEGKESAGVGSASLECLIQSRLHYIVEKENYITKDVYVDVGVEDTTINVVLTPKTKKTLTVNATPDNALIIFTDKPSNVVIAQGTGTLTYETYDPRDILIQVGASGYETYEERITLDENIIRDITLTALPVEQGAVSLTVVDSETKAKIAAYVYDKDTGGILGQVTKDTPLQLTGDVNTGRILRFVSSGYIEVEQLVTYAIPTAEVTVEMDKVPVQTGTIYATAVNTESTALDSVTFEYKLSTESDWKPLGNDESTTGKSEVVTAPVGTSVDFRASKTGYITNTGTGTINSTGEHSVTIVLEELPPEPEEVSVTIKAYEIYDNNKLYLAADIKEISSTGTTVGTTRPDEPLVITRNKGSVITYYALPLSSDWYNIGYEEVVFDTDKTVEILCLRNNNGLIKVRTRDALTGCMLSDTIYDETGKKIGNCDSSEDGYVSEANPIGFERNYKTLGDTRYEATEPALFIAAKPSEAVVNYIDLHPKEGQDYIALKFIDSVTKAPITTGISCRFSSSVKTIVTDYQGIAHISGTYDSKVVILVRRDGYTEYNQSYDNLANHSVTTIELVPEPVFENDGIDYMQIEGNGIEHPIFRVGDVESN